MRKYQQQKILELLQILEKAHSDLQKRLTPGAAVNLLVECKNFALQIKGYIEEISNKGTRTAALLEEYSKIAYQASRGAGGINYIKKLKTQLIKVVNLFKKELKPDRIEVVFFPYKYSMADCFESIWLAAMTDPQCDVYICPIPYYDRLPGGAFGEMHYEGHFYPETLPLVDWQEYDVEARHPDIIFVHNPYDDANYVTSIHPNFYSKRLKAFTDLLCYVPYFVCVGEVQEHFCVNAGTIYADKVFVESEKIRQTYIRMFKEFEKAKNCRGQFGKPECKFVALSSPKYDKTVNSKRENFILPEAWAKLVDGKKVIFYNTSIGTMLQYDEQYLKKIRSVLDTFRVRNDVVLWWRPHPLNGATYQSMRPQLFDEYKHIISSYKQEGLGIFDDTPDLHRAIAWSDAYYGDGSSVCAMYVVTGKLVMIQNYNIFNKTKDSSITMSKIQRPFGAYSIEDIASRKNIYDLYYYEDSNSYLDNYLDYVVYRVESYDANALREKQLEIFKQMCEFSDGTAGTAIYAYCKDNLR